VRVLWDEGRKVKGKIEMERENVYGCECVGVAVGREKGMRYKREEWRVQ
jgi:hypothetical protein